MQAAIEEWGIILTSDDVHISYLPSSHALEYLVQWYVLMSGASMGFMKKDLTTLMDDIKLLRPTFLPAVPWFLNKVYDVII